MEHQLKKLKIQHGLDVSVSPNSRQADFESLLQPFPIAAAICIIGKDNKLKLLGFNERYVDDGLQPNGSTKFDYNFALTLVHNAMRSKSGRVSQNWISNNKITPRQFHVTVAAYQFDGSERQFFLLTAVDQTIELEHERTIRREMITDSLTGLHNRAGFEEAIERHLQKIADKSDYVQKFAIFTLDLARFSQVNECAGALVGDELLISVASRIVNKMRKSDIIARLGGNDFGIFMMLPNGIDEIPYITSRIQSIFTKPFCLCDLEIKIDGAIGIALGKSGQNSGENHVVERVRQSQIAMKRAKESKQVEVYSPEVLDSARQRFILETGLRKAIQNNELILYYQPLIDLATRRVTGFEALSRWIDPVRGPIRPVDYIPVAEDCGLIVPLGRQALEMACNTLVKWDKKAGKKLGVKMNVNVSAVQFTRDDIVKVVAKILKDYKLDGDRLVLELTKSVFVNDPERAKNIMYDMRDLNVNLAIDDFGTGYSNLAYLQKLPIDILKIDRSFVSGMLDDKDKVAIVRAILSLASALGMSTTAEGIESQELCNTMAAMGCGFGQGYFYAPPLPEEEAFKLLKENHGL